jgi:hypothetical protein
MATTRASQQTVSRRLLHHVWPYWPYILGIFLLDLVATPLALLGPVPLKIAVDTVVGSQPLPPLLQAVLPDPDPLKLLLLRWQSEYWSAWSSSPIYKLWQLRPRTHG